MAPKDLIVRRSPFNEQVGYRLVEWREDYARVETIPTVVTSPTAAC
jgi:hypothetical protein